MLLGKSSSIAASIFEEEHTDVFVHTRRVRGRIHRAGMNVESVIPISLKFDDLRVAHASR